MSIDKIDPNGPDPGQDVGSNDTLQELEKLVADLAQPSYVFRLFVSGTTPRSSQAIANVRRLCERYLPGRYQLEVVDVYQQPASTRQQQVIAVPTLIKEFPLPPQRFVGDMSDSDRIVIGLNLRH
jgi:circadian clock protein KaiB